MIFKQSFNIAEEVMSQVEIEQKNNHEQFITNTGAVKKVTKQQKGDKTIIRKEEIFRIKKNIYAKIIDKVSLNISCS